MAAAFYLFAVQFWRDNYMQQRDWIWLQKINDVVGNREENLPDVGRYNAGQKLLFFTLVVCLIGLLLSGIVIWRVHFSAFFHVGLILAAPSYVPFVAFMLAVSVILLLF